MIDSTGIDFCELCGLTLASGVCPSCDPTRPVSKAGQRARADAAAITAYSVWWASKPPWKRAWLRAVAWLTREKGALLLDAAALLVVMAAVLVYLAVVEAR